MSVSVSRATLLQSRLGRFTRVLDGLEKGDVRALHRARVASRRLREVIPVLQLDADAAKKLSRRLRKITVRLGTVRELDVLLLVIDELREAYPDHQDALRRVAVTVTKSRDAARKRLREHLPSSDVRRVARKLDRILGELRDANRQRSADRTPLQGRALRWAIEARVARRAARLSAAIEDAGAVYLPERLHAVRVAVKKLRYGVELLAQLDGERKSAAVSALRRVQEVLGRMHDLQVLIDRVRAVQASLAPPNVTVWHELDALVLSLDDGCRRLHARYVRDRVALASMAAKLAAASNRDLASAAASRARGARRAG